LAFSNNPIEHITAATAASKATETPTDSAVLSVAAQALLLEQQGFNITEIAEQLGLPASTVQSDLGLTIAAIRTSAAAAGSRLS